MAEETNKQSTKIGYALCGGGARGFAHLGVLQYLEELNIYPEIISGTSAGALAGVFYADGYRAMEIKDLFKDKRLTQLATPNIGTLGLLKMDGLLKFLRENLRATSFDQLKIPLVVTATNWEDPKIRYFSNGDDLTTAVAASCAVPVAFIPMEIEGVQYVDGGVLQNLPARAIRERCETLIGVNLSILRSYNKAKNITQAASRYFEISSKLNVARDRELSDIVIDVEGVQDYHIFDLTHMDDIFQLGYEAAKAKQDELVTLAE